MNRWIVLGAAVLLAGCEGDTNGWVPGLEPDRQQQAQVAPEPQSVANNPAAPVDPYCHDIARQRMLDGKTYGYDRDTLKAVYKDAYDECEAWHTPATR